MNNVVTAKYRFDRPEKSVVGFGRPNRPSTDAKGAVETWSIRVPGRDVIIVEDEDEFIVAELSFRESDTNAATDLDALCVERGVERRVVCPRKNMGQAKQRGTAEERAKQAQEKRREGLTPVDVDELRATHGVPAEAEFVGFVVWLRERDEFLVHLEDTPLMTKRAYGPVIEAAVRFPTWDDAAPHAEASKHPAIVAAAFDMGKQIAVIGG